MHAAFSPFSYCIDSLTTHRLADNLVLKTGLRLNTKCRVTRNTIAIKGGKGKIRTHLKQIVLYEYFIIQVGKLMTVVCTNNMKATFKKWRESLLGNLLGSFKLVSKVTGKVCWENLKWLKVKVKMLWLKC